jgi:RimJ/RimL family protein N-acetyltransferase
MELRPVTLDDLPLYESILCDPAMMAELGGPLPRERLPERLRRDVDAVAADSYWMYKIVPDAETGVAAGTVCIWEHPWRGERINEIGWMVLPAFQGRGVGSQAVRTILDKARAEARWDVIDAFPAVTNAASNGICRKTGFTLVEACDFEFAGRTLRCNRWRIDLRPAGPS